MSRNGVISYGERARIGMLLPSGNVAAEPQFQAMIPAGISVHTTRLELAGSSDDELLNMTTNVDSGARLLADAKVDLILFNCTAVSTWSESKEAEILHRIQEAASIKAIATSQAIVAALNEFDARNVVLVTPYLPSINRREIGFLERHGFNVLSCSGMALETPAQMIAVEPRQWIDLAAGSRQEKADAYLISCTAIRSAEVIEPLEDLLQRPVVASNQAAAWLALRTLRVVDPSPGFGRLFRKGSPQNNE